MTVANLVINFLITAYVLTAFASLADFLYSKAHKIKAHEASILFMTVNSMILIVVVAFGLFFFLYQIVINWNTKIF